MIKSWSRSGKPGCGLNKAYGVRTITVQTKTRVVSMHYHCMMTSILDTTLSTKAKPLLELYLHGLIYGLFGAWGLTD